MRNSTCQLPGCEARHHSGGWCIKHLRRVQRHGSPHVVKQIPYQDGQWPSWSHVVIGESCWLWTGPLNPGGYGTNGGRLAHRVVYERLIGQIPAGLTLDHLCRVRNCVNPQHLEPVTIAENLRRRPAKAAA